MGRQRIQNKDEGEINCLNVAAVFVRMCPERGPIDRSIDRLIDESVGELIKQKCDDKAHFLCDVWMSQCVCGRRLKCR